MDWNAITLSFIENAMWPLVTLVLIVVVMVFGNLKHLIESIKSLKVGSFSVETREAAKKVDAYTEYENLTCLTYEQLHLFLVIGGEGGESIEYKNKMNTLEFNEGFKKLSELGLVKYEVKPEGIFFGNTEKGKALHKVLMDNLYHQFNA